MGLNVRDVGVQGEQASLLPDGMLGEIDVEKGVASPFQIGPGKATTETQLVVDPAQPHGSGTSGRQFGTEAYGGLPTMTCAKKIGLGNPNPANTRYAERASAPASRRQRIIRGFNSKMGPGQ